MPARIDKYKKYLEDNPEVKAIVDDMRPKTVSNHLQTDWNTESVHYNNSRTRDDYIPIPRRRRIPGTLLKVSRFSWGPSYFSSGSVS